ncbi:MAG: type VI secretion system baseplate subunit TssF [Myxococcales bacterium]|nr:type VI secretion system baseplate subunit TssF [Myxococcales bacterium]
MDPRLLELYNRELAFLRAMGDEFRHHHPSAAERIGMDTVPWRDPHAERIVEGVAALTARVQARIEDEFPRFTRSLLGLMYPQFLAPTPSMAVARLVPRSQAPAGGRRIDRHTELSVRSGDTRCRYRTAQEVTFWPLELCDVQFSRDVPSVTGTTIPMVPVGAALRLRFRAPQGVAALQGLQHLPLYVGGRDPASVALFEILAFGASALAVRGTSEEAFSVVASSGSPVVHIGFEDERALLPTCDRTFQGFRLLHEFLALPDRLFFVELRGLDAALGRVSGESEFEVLLLLPRSQLLETADLGQMEAVVGTETLSLYCTPVVNLFGQPSRVPLDERLSEYRVTPGPLAPLDCEIYSVDRVTGVGQGRPTRRVEFDALYDPGSRSDAFFHAERRPAGQTGQDRSAGYEASDVYLSLVDGAHGPFRRGLRHLELETQCTNRALPHLLAGQIVVECEAHNDVDTVELMTGLTSPRPSPVRGDVLWQLVGFLSPNFLSLLAGERGTGEPPLRRLLELCAGLAHPGGDRSTRAHRHIQGLRSIRSSPAVCPLLDGGPVSYARGTRIVLEFEDRSFQGSSPLLLASVLAQFFSRYASINAVTETVLVTAARGEVKRWQTRGQRPLL